MYESTTLDNKLTVITESVPGAQSVAIGALVDAGPQQDPPGKEGLAHLTEHALFLGTSGRTAADISQTIDEAGGRMGAFTSRDFTCYYGHVMGDYCPFVWDLLGDIFLNSTFPDEGVNVQRDIVLRELALGADDLSARLNDSMKQFIWSGHRLGQPIAGTSKSVRNLTRDDITRFVGQNYTADRIVLAAAGAVTHEDAVSQARDAMWRLTSTSMPSRQLDRQVQFRSGINIDRCNSTNSYFGLAFPAASYESGERYSVHALNTILCGGMSSRLYSSLRDSLGWVYDIASSYHAYKHAGVICIEGVSSPALIPAIVEVILHELASIANSGISDEELWRVKNQLRGQHQLASDSLHTRMSRMLSQHFYFGNVLKEHDVLDGIDRVTCDSIQSQAALLLCSDERSLTLVGPSSPSCCPEALSDIVYADRSTISS